MSRSISTALQNHLALECTSVATCWKITRRDGVEFFFTDHDQDLVITGDTYVAREGFDRTAIKNTASFTTDNLDLTALFATSQITRTQIANGQFDFSEIEIFLVNHQDLTMGNLILRRGVLGEVTSTPSGRFIAEMRGLKQRMSQVFGDKFQAECRADLGDTKCKVPVQPPVVQRGVAYAVGQFVRAATGNPSATLYAVPVANAGFESNLSGWTTFSGSPIAGVFSSPSAYEGTRYLTGQNPSDSFQIYQTVDLTTSLDFLPDNVDNGFVSMVASVRRATAATDQNDAGRFRVQALDENGLILQTLWDTGYDIPEDNVWELRSVADVLVPPLTRQLRVWCEGDKNTGVVVNAAFDDINVDFVDSGTDIGVQEVYDNRIYECTTAGTTAASQPSFDTVIGNSTTDGTAVFRSFDAWSRHGVVNTVTDSQAFTVTLSESRAADGWFNGGLLTWETGQNAGRSYEVKAWSRTASDLVTLYLPCEAVVSTGDRLRIYPGCDKRLVTCAGRFRMSGSRDFASGNFLNFRGEPFLPGRDALGRYPDAK